MTQQTLREKIKEIIQESHGCVEYDCYQRHDEDITAILQQVIGWVEDQAEKENHNVDIDILISHLKEEV